jgi:hypothetical protein
MTASSSWRKVDPGDEYVDEMNREGVCGDGGGRLSRRPSRTEDATVDVILAPDVSKTFLLLRPPRPTTSAFCLGRNLMHRFDLRGRFAACRPGAFLALPLSAKALVLNAIRGTGDTTTGRRYYLGSTEGSASAIA